MDGDEIRETRHRRLVVDLPGWDDAPTTSTTTTTATATVMAAMRGASVPARTAPAAATKAHTMRAPSAAAGMSKSVVVTPSVKAAPTPPPPPTPAAASEVELHELVNPAELVSLEVLTYEIGELSKLGTSEANELKDELQFRVQMLETQVQCGALSQAAYVASLQKRILLDKSAAKQFNAAGDKARALRHLRRAKIMESELAS